MKKLKSEILSEKEKLEIIDFYKKHSRPLTCKKFNICYEVLLQILLSYNICKHSQKEGNFLSKMDKYGYSFYSEEQEKNIVSFYTNNSFSYTIQKFNIRDFYLTYLLDKYHIRKHDRNTERKLSSLIIYGTEHPSQSSIVKDKSKHVKASKSEDEIIAANIKRKQTLLYKYGDEKYNNRNKAKETCIKKYGVDNIFKSPVFQENKPKILMEKYGSNNYTNREKAKITCITKYGAETFLGSEIGQQMIKDYNNTKYGVDYAFQSKIWQKTELDHRKKLFANNYNNRTAAYNTCLDKYGVGYYCISDNCRGKGNGYKSKPNDYFAKLLDDNNIDYVREFKLEKYSYDFKIENTLVEINPTITHNITYSPYTSDINKYRTYHKEKTYFANNHGYRCVNVWDWSDINIILDIINPKKEKIFARKCVCKIIDKKIANDFINNNHMQKSCRGNIYNFGLYYKDKLIQVMTFGKPRYNKKYDLELLRLCTLLGYIVIGGSQKLFSFALKHMTGKTIISYCDNSLFSGNTYLLLGFKFDKLTVNKHWYNIKTKKHILDSYLNSLGFDKIFKTTYGKNTSNTELMKQAGFLEIYDAGQSTYVFNRIC